MPRRQATPEAAHPDTIEPDETQEPDEPEIGPLRRCVVTRERLPKEKMIRFVIGPDQQVIPDLAARLPGRGIWLSARWDVLETARSRGAFAKAARANVLVPPDLTSALQAALARRVVDHLGLARRAGQAVSGFQKAREWLVAGRVALIVQAKDGSADERERFLGGRGDKVPVVAPLDAAMLGAVFGRDHAVHVAIAKGQLAERLLTDSERLAGLMALPAAAGGEGKTGGGGRAGRRRKNETPRGAVARDDEQGAGDT